MTQPRRKFALVTGGTRGIGAAIARKLKSDGMNVAALYVGDENAALAFKTHSSIDIAKADVTDYAATEAAIKELTDKYGPVDVLVNNAGITRDGFLHKMDPKDWGDVINTNLTSCFNLARIVVPTMREQGYGRIVSISSINGLKGQLGQTNYSAAKAGIIGFSKALALENVTKGITVNVVAPGYIETDMTMAMGPDIVKAITAQIPMGHMGKPEDIADLVAFLASDSASYITGATFSANGGQYMQ